MNTATNTNCLEKPTKARFFILFLVCCITCINYLDRTNLAVAAPFLQRDMGLDAAMMGIVFSAFGWSYTFVQIPCGWILDRFGPRLVYGIALFGWSIFTFFIGFARSLTMLIVFRLALGLFEAPAFPTNARIVTGWFPSHERGLAIGAYTGAEYVGLAFFTPFLTWLVVTFSWSAVFIVTGILGILMWGVWRHYYREPKEYKKVNQAELDYISNGGGLAKNTVEAKKITWKEIRHLFIHRQLWGMYIGQFAVTSTLFFFMTWFPSYLVTAKGMAMLKAGFYAAVPFISAIVGVLVGGKTSDWALTRGYSLGIARKGPVIIGLLLSCVIIGANYTDDINLVIGAMSVAFFGQGISSAVSWALLSEIAPKELLGLTGSVFNFCANLGGTITPLVVGLIVNATHSFETALAFVAGVALVGALSYIFIVGNPKRIEITESKALVG